MLKGSAGSPERTYQPLWVLCGKLLSRQPKDFDDLLAAWDTVDREALRERVHRVHDAGVESHYLPDGWKWRVRPLPRSGETPDAGV